MKGVMVEENKNLLKKLTCSLPKNIGKMYEASVTLVLSFLVDVRQL